MSKFYSQQAVFIALQPQYNINSELVSLSIKLLNQTTFTIRYECYFATDKRPEKHLQNTVLSGEIFTMEGLLFIELNDNPTIDIQIEVNEDLVEKSMKLKAKTFFNTPPYSQLLQAEAFLYELWKEENFETEEEGINKEEFEEEETEEDAFEEPTEKIDVSKLELLKESLMGANKPLKNKIIHEPAPDKIDLHIEAINPEYEKLHPSEIVAIQMKIFEQTIERGIASGKHSIIVIHGVGDGILKKKIRNYCSTHPRIKNCSDPLVNHYGVGATEIYFK